MTDVMRKALEKIANDQFFHGNDWYPTHAAKIAKAALAANNQEAWVAALLNAPNPEQALAATPEPDMSDVTDDVSPDVASAIRHFYNNAYALQKNEATPAVGGEDDTLPRCKHGNCLKDGAGEILEPPCGCRALPASPLRGRDTLATLIREYARDLRRNSSGGDDYPWEYAKGTADYLEVLIGRAAAPPEQPAAGDGETKA